MAALTSNSQNSLQKRKAVVNIKNADNQCFKRCITKALNPVDKDPQRITKLHRAQSEQLYWSNINFIMKLTDISKFEKNENIALNMLGYKCDFYPWRISKEKNRTHINLLLISDEHYCLINNMSRLLSSQTSKDEKTRVLSRVFELLLKQRKACTP